MDFDFECIVFTAFSGLLYVENQCFTTIDNYFTLYNKYLDFLDFILNVL